MADKYAVVTNGRAQDAQPIRRSGSPVVKFLLAANDGAVPEEVNEYLLQPDTIDAVILRGAGWPRPVRKIHGRAWDELRDS